MKAIGGAFVKLLETLTPLKGHCQTSASKHIPYKIQQTNANTEGDSLVT